MHGYGYLKKTTVGSVRDKVDPSDDMQSEAIPRLSKTIAAV